MLTKYARKHNLLQSSETETTAYVDADDRVVIETVNDAAVVVPKLRIADKIEHFSDQGGGWRDMVGQITFIGSDIADPTRQVILSSGHQGYKFDIGKNFEITYHFQHDYAPGTPIYFHVHWVAAHTPVALPDPDPGPDLNPVTWLFHYVYSRGFGRGTFDFSPDDDVNNVVTATEAPLAPSALIATPTVYDQLVHMTTEITLPIVNPLFEPDGILLLHLHRVNNADAIPTNPATDNLDAIYVMTADCHYQANTFATLNRQPNFYGP